MGKLSHYFAERPEVPSERRLVSLRLGDLELDLFTDRGVFAGDRVDSGTLALLEEAPPPPAGARRLLDLGCGYGPIALTLARRAPQAEVWAVDVNARALELTRENAAVNGCRNLRACRPDEVPEAERFDAIYSNPPVRIGKQGLHDLLVEWLGRLAEGGAAHVVVQRHLGADSLATWLKDQGFAVARTKSKRGYRVLAISGPGAVGRSG